MKKCKKMRKIIAKYLEKLKRREKNVSEIAKILWVSRPTIYSWKLKYEEDGEIGLLEDNPWPKIWKAWNRTKREIEEVVVEYLKRYPLDGPLVIKERLEEQEGIILHSTTIWRIWKRRHIKYWARERKKQKRERKLYALNQPGELQVDVTFPYWRSKNIFVYNAIDDCTRWVYSEVREDFWIVDSIVFIKNMLERIPLKVERIRTDNWTEFGRQFTRYLENVGIEHIKNEPYMPQHNGKVERYNGTFKSREVVYRTEEMELEELQYRNYLRVSYYNTQRKHSGLWMENLTPLQKLMNYLLSTQCVKLSLQQNKNL